MGRSSLPQRGREAEGAEIEFGDAKRLSHDVGVDEFECVRSPFQGFSFFAGVMTQGVALGRAVGALS